jgi:hypothetical protein
MIRFRTGDQPPDNNQQSSGGTESTLNDELSRALHARIRHAYYDRPEVLRELARKILDDLPEFHKK